MSRGHWTFSTAEVRLSGSRWTRRHAVVLLATLALTAAACGGGGASNPSPASAGPPSGALTVWVGSWWQPIVPKVKEAFARAYPKVALNIEPLPISGYLDKAISSTLGGDPPDVVDLDANWISSMAGRHLLQPLDAYAQGLPKNDFSPAIWNSSHFGGKLYAIPDRDGSEVYFYNKTVFDEAHVPYPTNSWTYQDLLSIALKLTVPGQRYGVGMAADISDPSNVLSSFAPVLWAYGGNFLNDANTRAVINSPASVRAITFWTQLYTRYKVAPPGTPGFSLTKDVQPLFQNNQIGLMPGTSNVFNTFSMRPDLQWGMVQAPNHVGLGGGYAMAMPVGAKNPAAARAFMLWLAQPQIMGTLLNRAPARQSALKYPPWNTAQFAPLRDALPYQRSVPNVASWSQMQNDLITELQKILTGAATPQQGADTLEGQMNGLLKAQH